jgi:aurora kinase
MCGTVEYLPPELVGGTEYGFGVDMWCVGVLAYEMLAGVSPFYDAGGQDAIMARIAAGRPAPDRRLRGMRAAWDLITRLLQQDPSRRLSATEVLQHRWVTEHAGPYAPQACVTEWVEQHGEGLAAAARRGVGGAAVR